MAHTFNEKVILAACEAMLQAQNLIEEGSGGNLRDLSDDELRNLYKIAKAALVGGLREAAKETQSDNWANAVAGCVVSVLADRLQYQQPKPTQEPK